MILHIFNKFPTQEQLNTIKNQNILLLDDAVYFLNNINNINNIIYVIKEDIEIRAINSTNNINIINYSDFLKLFLAAEKTISW